MPLQLTITQETGVNATYHVVEVGSFNLAGSKIQVTLNSYLDQPSFANGKEYLSQISLDASPVLATPAPTPTAGQTIQQAVQSILEAYLLTTPTFTGATQVS
jgi:hypothetical protein